MYTGDPYGRGEKTSRAPVEKSAVDPIINARSIAVVGASNRPGSVGLAAFKNLLGAGYKGVLYPVNPKDKSIQGVKAYPALERGPGPRGSGGAHHRGRAGSRAVRSAAGPGVKGCVVITAGFKEIGGHGRRALEKAQGRARRHGIRIIGPNCLGVDQHDPGGAHERQFRAAHAQRRATSPSFPSPGPWAPRCSITPPAGISAFPSS